jgi:metallo-beta-lactamase class B
LIPLNIQRAISLAAICALFLVAQLLGGEVPGEWTTPFPPFRIAGNLYYVGSEDLASYLITTPRGDILINSNLASSPALIRQSVTSLGFRFADIKILLISHGHYDHCAGSAEIVRETHARYEVMAPDVSVIQSGGRTDFNYGRDPSTWFEPAHVDRVLGDGDKVALGGAVLTAHLTAGHTKGTTTWTLEEQNGNRLFHVVIVGSPNVNPGYRLLHNPRYPRIAADYRRQFAILSRLPCDIFLGAHGGYFGLKEKYQRFQAEDADAFVDPAGYKDYVADRQRAFEAEWKRQATH